MPGQAHGGEAPHKLYRNSDCMRIPTSSYEGARARAVQAAAKLVSVDIAGGLPPVPTRDQIIGAIEVGCVAQGFHTQVEEGRGAVYVWTAKCGVCE